MLESSTNCTITEEPANTDAGVSGPGVLLSFVITAYLAFGLSSIIMTKEACGKGQSSIIRKLLIALSDQQILTGISIQAVGLANIRTIIPYHFFIIWMLSLLSTATHLSALIALVRDFQRDWVLRWLRYILKFANLVLSCTYGIIILKVGMKGLSNTTVPVSCVFQGITTQHSSKSIVLDMIGTIVVIVANCAIFACGVWYLHIWYQSRSFKWFRIVQGIMFTILVAIGIGATVRVFIMSQAFGKPTVALKGEGEKEWSFGQVVPLLLLLLPAFSGLEIARGEVKISSCVSQDQLPLNDMYQPNPFFGSKAPLIGTTSE